MRQYFRYKFSSLQDEEPSHDEEGIIGTRAYHRNVPRK